MNDVYRFALSLSRDESEAGDIVQETYLRALKSWRTFRKGSDCRKWLFAICRNVFLRQRERDRARADSSAVEVDSLAAVNDMAAATTAEQESLLRLDLAPALRSAIDMLQEPFRSAVILVDVEDHSYDDASVVLGVPVGTVRSRLFRGRRLLQRQLLDFARDAGFGGLDPDTGEAS